jgi:hypothetical protein
LNLHRYAEDANCDVFDEDEEAENKLGYTGRVALTPGGFQIGYTDHTGCPGIFDRAPYYL